MKTKLKDLPLFIVKVSRRYYMNTITGKYIRTENLEKYLEDNKDRRTEDSKDKPVDNYWWNKD